MPGNTAPTPCPKCGGAMWDNSQDKRNPRAPDYKCKDRDNCDGAVWLKDGEKGNGSAGSARRAPAKRGGAKSQPKQAYSYGAVPGLDDEGVDDEPPYGYEPPPPREPLPPPAAPAAAPASRAPSALVIPEGDDIAFLIYSKCLGYARKVAKQALEADGIALTDVGAIECANALFIHFTRGTR